MAFPTERLHPGRDRGRRPRRPLRLGRRRERRGGVRAGHHGRGPGGHRDRRAATSTPDIDVETAALDDAWMRDIGPTFVTGRRRPARRGGLGLQRLGRPGLGHLGQGLAVGGGSRRGPLGSRAASCHRWSTRAAASTWTVRARSWSPRRCSWIRAATPGSARPTSRPSWPAPSAPPTSSGCRAD